MCNGDNQNFIWPVEADHEIGKTLQLQAADVVGALVCFERDKRVGIQLDRLKGLLDSCDETRAQGGLTIAVPDCGFGRFPECFWQDAKNHWAALWF